MQHIYRFRIKVGTIPILTNTNERNGATSNTSDCLKYFHIPILGKKSPPGRSNQDKRFAMNRFNPTLITRITAPPCILMLLVIAAFNLFQGDAINWNG